MKAKISKVNFGEGIEKYIILTQNNATKKYDIFQDNKNGYVETIIFNNKFEAEAFAIGAGFEIGTEEKKTDKLKGITYNELLKFILDNVEYTYNVSKCLDDFITGLGETGVGEGVFFMTKDQECFNITTHFDIKNQGTEDEEIKYTYDVEKL